MNKLLKILFFIMLFSINLFSSNLNTILKTLHKNYDNVTTFRAEFTQISFFKAVNQVQKFKGTLYLKRPNKMKWDYSYPEIQLIVSNGENIWYYYPGENQVNVGKLSKGSKERNLIFMLLEGITKVEKEFHLKLIDGKDNNKFYYIQLVPISPSTLFDKIILTVSKKNFKITTSHVFYLSGDIVKLTFEKVFLNIPLKDTIFNFTPPPGTEVFKIPAY